MVFMIRSLMPGLRKIKFYLRIVVLVNRSTSSSSSSSSLSYCGAALPLPRLKRGTVLGDNLNLEQTSITVECSVFPLR